MFASTHDYGTDCPPHPDQSYGYVWPLYDYDIYVGNRDGSGLHNITHTPGYDAEATVRADGRIVFTSTRSGDIELWSMDPDGGNLVQLTHTLGYDGGAFFSPDGSKLVWRAGRPRTEAEQKEYTELLARNLVKPTSLDIWVADADGSNAYQVTDFGKASFAPYIAPDEWQSLDESVSRWEDPRALVAQKNGLELIEKIIAVAPSFIKSNDEMQQKNCAQLMLEVGYKQGPAVADLLTAAGYNHVAIHTDLEGKDRVASGRTDDMAATKSK